MDKKECAKKDYMVLDAFYKEYFNQSHIQLGYLVIGGIFVFILVMMCWFPYYSIIQDLNEGLLIALIIGAGGTVAYMTAYQHAFDRKGAVVKIAPYLQYLPISLKARKKYLLWKLLKLQWKVYVVAQVGQIVFALLAVHELAWGNFLYPFLAALVIPVVMSVLSMSIMATK